MSAHEVVCFHCGQGVGDPPRLNLIDGEPCTACAERLLETLPGVFHTPFEPVGSEEEVSAVEGGAMGPQGFEPPRDYAGDGSAD
jgi:hypothetical protein